MDEVLKDPKDLALSKALSWLLRHGAVAEGLDISKDGYIQLRDVLKHRLFTRRYTIDDIRRIASIDNYRFNLQKNPITGSLEIRANRGHTINLQKASSNLIKYQPYKSGKTQLEYKQQQYNRVPLVDTFASPHSEDSDDGSFFKSYITYPQLTRILNWMLRHGAKRAGLTKSPDGFVPVDELLEHDYLKGKCSIEDIITVADNEPEVYELKKNPETQLLEIRLNVNYTVKTLNKVELTIIPHSVYLPLPYVIRGVNECEWEEVNNIGGIRSKSADGYIYFSPYEPADYYATKGVTRHDDIYIYVGVDAAIEDGIEFYKTSADEIITKGNEDGFVTRDYYVKVVERKSGVEQVPRNVMYRIFNKYGPVIDISEYEGKHFCFIKYSDKRSPQRALKARVFYKGRRLFVRNVKPQNNDQNAGGRNVYQEQEDLDIEISTISVQSDGVKSVFDLQVEELISRVQLGEDEDRKHLEICNDLEDTFKFLGASAIIFGSCGNNLAMKNSDIDIYLDCTHGQPEETFVTKDCKVMYKSKLYSHIIRIGKARVPIVRFIHRKTGIRCDVTVKNKLGVMNSKLIKFLVSLDQRIRPFIMLLKYWAKEYSITANSQLSSYALIMMAIFYLQQLKPPLLPPISKLTTSDEIQGGWHCGFIDNPWGVSLQQNNISLKEMVKGFFEFYATFEYNKYVICPLLGQPVLVDDFETPERLPAALEAYKKYIRDNQDYPFKINFPLRIQDPFELNYNLGRGFTEKLLKMVCDTFWQSYSIFKENEDENDLLSSLLVVNKKLRCVKQDEKTFRIPWSIQGSDEKCVKRQPPTSTSEAVNEWYTLVKKAVLIVFKDVLKLNLEEADSNISNKIKKSSNQNDVHTFEKSVFHCTGNTVVFANRKKIRKRLVMCGLDEFEKDVEVSNSRQCCQVDHSKSLSFLASVSLNIPSANEIPHVLISLQDCNMCKGNFFNPLMDFLRSSFETFVEHAITHIRMKRKTSGFIEITDLLNCDCDGNETVNKNQTVKSKNKNSCIASTSNIQLNEKTKVDEKVIEDKLIKPTVNIESADLLNCDCDTSETVNKNQTVKRNNKNNCVVNTSAIQLNEKTKVDEKVNDDEIVTPSVNAESTHLLNCDCDGSENKILTVKPKNKNSCIPSTSAIQLNEKIEVDEKVNDDKIIKPTVNTQVRMTNKISDCSVDIDNPFLVAIERHISNGNTDNTLSSTNSNSSDNGSQTLWSKNNNEPNNDNINDFGNKLGNSETNYSKIDTNNKTDYGKTGIDCKTVNDVRTGSSSKKISDEETGSNVVENVHFVSEMLDTLAVQKENNGISHSVQEVHDMVSTHSNRQICELKNVENTSAENIPVNHYTYSRDNKPSDGNVNHDLTWNKTSYNQTKINHTLGFISMKAEHKLSKINLEIKPPTKKTVTVEDIKLYVQERFQCKNVDEGFLLALTKITNDIKNNSNKS